MKPLLIGEAPSRTGEGRPPFDGGRLPRLLGCPAVDVFEVVNLFDEWPGRDGKGSLFPAVEARERAARMELGERAVVFVGQRVARAFNFAAPYLDWRWHGKAVAAVFPHPSGINRWWNDPEHLEQARAFLIRCKVGAT